MKSRCSFYEEEEKIIGTSGMSFIEKPPYFGCPSGKIGLLSSMFTDPDYRRMGIAKELLHRVVEEARLQTYFCAKFFRKEEPIVIIPMKYLPLMMKMHL